MISIDSLINIAIELVIVIAIFVKQGCTIETVKEDVKAIKTTITEFKKDTKENLSEFKEELKEEVKEKLQEFKQDTEEHIKRLEEKQDKHNHVIERMVVCEQSLKSTHHRLDALEGKFNENIRKWG